MSRPPSRNPLETALQYLTALATPTPPPHHRRGAGSLDAHFRPDSIASSLSAHKNMDTRSSRLLSPAWLRSSSRASSSASEVRHSEREREEDNAIPLIDFSRSRSASPYPRSRGSAAQSEDEEEEEVVESGMLLRPLVDGGRKGGSRWARMVKNGRFGGWLMGTWVGWQVYVGLLVAWTGMAGFGLVLMNRFILWSRFLLLR